MSEELEKRLREAGSQGLDLSPGDPLCAEAAAELKAQREEIARLEGRHLFPLQVSKREGIKPGPRQIPWSVAEKAYAVYASKYGRRQTLERLAERGGFGWCEMDDFYPEWRQEVSEVARTIEAEGDRDHWEEQAAKNHEATLEAMRENAVLRETLDQRAAILKQIEAENDRLQAMLTAGSQQILTLQLCLTECEKACWREGQTLEGLVRVVRRSAAEHLEGKNPAKQLINENDRLREALRELADFPPWGGADFAAFTKWVQGKAKAALGEQDES